MKKMGQQLKDRLVLQAQEAKTQGMEHLSDGIFRMIMGVDIKETTNHFNYDELSKIVQQSLWEATGRIATYHDLPMVDVQRMMPLIAEAAEKFIREVERSYDVENKLGPFEEDLPGQNS